MRSFVSAVACLAALGVCLAPTPALAGTGPLCTINSVDVTCGGSSADTATAITMEDETISLDYIDGSQWFDFSWGGGTLTISATLTTSESVSAFGLQIDDSTPSLVDSASFTGSDPSYSASMTETNLAAGTYEVGFLDDPVGVNGTLTFDVPEPASLALLLAGLGGVGAIRRRNGARPAAH